MNHVQRKPRVCTDIIVGGGATTSTGWISTHCNNWTHETCA